jgi:membrane fusion protein, copper/silver efflux system
MKPIYAMLAGTALFICACNEKTAPKEQSIPPAAKQEIGLRPEFAVPDTFKTALGKVFEGYVRIEDALAHDDLPKAQEAFGSMHAILHMIPIDELDSTAGSYWKATDDRIMSALHPMASAKTLEATRAHFMEFSLIMTEAIEKLGISGGTRVYLFHCPMARENKGAEWLQNDSTLANPYFGKSMATCGRLVREIKIP